MIQLELPLAVLGDLTPAQRKRMLRQLLEHAKAATPVKTGRLRDGWYLDGDILRNDVPYAEFVNDGTPRMSPRNMTGIALAQLGLM